MARFQYTNRSPTIQERLLMPAALRCDIGAQVALLKLRRIDALAEWSDYFDMDIETFQVELNAMNQALNEWVAFQSVVGGFEVSVEGIA